MDTDCYLGEVMFITSLLIPLNHLLIIWMVLNKSLVYNLDGSARVSTRGLDIVANNDTTCFSRVKFLKNAGVFVHESFHGLHIGRVTGNLQFGSNYQTVLYICCFEVLWKFKLILKLLQP